MTIPAGLHRDSPLRRSLRSPTVRALAALVFVFLIGSFFNADGTFFRWHTHRDMLRHISVFGILACGMTLVIICSGIDLAVGSVLGFSAVLFSLLSLQLGWSAWLAVPVNLVPGVACGLTSGGLIAKFKIQPFIATLAMMVFARGLAKWISGGRKISTAIQLADGNYRSQEVPAVFKAIGSKLLAENIAVVTLIFLACVLACFVLRPPPLGAISLRRRRERGGGPALRGPGGQDEIPGLRPVRTPLRSGRHSAMPSRNSRGTPSGVDCFTS